MDINQSPRHALDTAHAALDMLQDFERAYGKWTMRAVLEAILRDKALPLVGFRLFSSRFTGERTAAFAGLPVQSLIQLQRLADGSLFRTSDN